MWMNSLSTDKSDSREEILISLLLDLANTQVSLTSDIELAAKSCLWSKKYEKEKFWLYCQRPSSA